MGDLPVYDVVLLPPAGIAAEAVKLSRQCAEPAGAEFVLTEERVYPHLSLFMAVYTPEQRAAAVERLAGIGRRTPVIDLRADRFAGNEHGMFELFYDKSEAITALQEDVLAAVAPLRAGWRRHDPVGRVLADYRLSAPAPARDNLERYGYDEVGELFRPHITLTRFQQRDHQVDPALLPSTQAFTAAFDTLALCVMGEHGTCTEIVARFTLAGAEPVS
ncbi:2'-5' RNA ligase family protein [Nonomuraea sp. NPDC050536]|uniref:2'-5' RNA ligase family protein n=1 Tax=Nonomuraea sp. NPDC050536 TaxID=3364366 RepID=UPI0037C81102